MCAAAGGLLVLLLTWLNLTITEGVLNGLIFYANIIQVNKDIKLFFPPDSCVNPLAIFIAWMNLDLESMFAFTMGWIHMAKYGCSFFSPFTFGF